MSKKYSLAQLRGAWAAGRSSTSKAAPRGDRERRAVDSAERQLWEVFEKHGGMAFSLNGPSLHWVRCVLVYTLSVAGNAGMEEVFDRVSSRLPDDQNGAYAEQCLEYRIEDVKCSMAAVRDSLAK